MNVKIIKNKKKKTLKIPKGNKKTSDVRLHFFHKETKYKEENRKENI